MCTGYSMSKQSGLNAYRVFYEQTVRADLEGGEARGGERGDAQQRQAGALARRHGGAAHVEFESKFLKRFLIFQF